MSHYTHEININTRGKRFYELTDEITRWTSSLSVQKGLLTVFIQHTSASLLIQENADPSVVRDLEAFFSSLVPENSSLYTHTMEGPDDMPAHIIAALTQSQISIPIIDGLLALGTWQGIYLFEHRHRSHRRCLALHVSGM